MTFEDRGVNKIGYALLAGVLSLAYTSETDPHSGALSFVVAFLITFMLILVLEMMNEFNDLVRERKADRLGEEKVVISTGEERLA